MMARLLRTSATRSSLMLSWFIPDLILGSLAIGMATWVVLRG